MFIIVNWSFKSKYPEPEQENIIFTATPSANSIIYEKFPEKSQIFLIRNSESEPTILSESFYSARSPEISYDGLKMLFAAQKEKGDTWQIWQMDLGSSSTRQITSRSFNCTDPAYLPDDGIVFSSQSQDIGQLSGVIALFTIDIAGSNEIQITFHPSVDQNPTVLSDGRILTNTHQIYPKKDRAMQLVLRPDGTKAEMFYEPTSGAKLTARGWETDDGRFVYIEKPIEGSSRVITISQNRPLHSGTDISADYNGNFHSVFPVHNKQYLVSYQQDSKQNFSLYYMKTQGKSQLELIYANNDYHLIEPVIVKIRPKPKNLPSRIVEGSAMGVILCMDANLSQNPGSANSKASTVEVYGVKTSLGRVPVAKDGSFYIKVPSNTPLQFQTFDNSGQVISGPSDWIWVRPNERRGCVGCHADRELSPENRVPLAVGEKPLSLFDYQKNSTIEQQ